MLHYYSEGREGQHTVANTFAAASQAKTLRRPSGPRQSRGRSARCCCREPAASGRASRTADRRDCRPPRRRIASPAHRARPETFRAEKRSSSSRSRNAAIRRPTGRSSSAGRPSHPRAAPCPRNCRARSQPADRSARRSLRRRRRPCGPSWRRPRSPRPPPSGKTARRIAGPGLPTSGCWRNWPPPGPFAAARRGRRTSPACIPRPGSGPTGR